MSEEIDKHVLKKYEVQQRLGKGVSAAASERAAGGGAVVVRSGRRLAALLQIMCACAQVALHCVPLS